MSGWALKFHVDHLSSVAALWNVAGAEALLHEHLIWVKVREPDEATLKLLPTLACEARYQILPGGALLIPGNRVPLGYLPQGNWKPMRQLLQIKLPVASFPARGISKISVELVPSNRQHVANVVLTTLNDWYRYARSASQLRLSRCQFAVCRDARVLIWGIPLPPIAGLRAVEACGIVIPCGWSWSPKLDAALLAQAWNIKSGNLCLLWPGAPAELITADQLVMADHSAVQLTWEAFQHA